MMMAAAEILLCKDRQGDVMLVDGRIVQQIISDRSHLMRLMQRDVLKRAKIFCFY